MIGLDECELVTFISAVACAMAKCYTDDELSMLSAIFTQLGDSLATILARRDICSNSKEVENPVTKA